jgi:hypothetical protein
MAWLLDTNILSELRRPKPEQKVVAFVANCPLDQLYISAVTLAEIRFGIELVGEPNRRADLNDWLTNKIRPCLANGLSRLPKTLCSSGGSSSRKAGRWGHTFSQPDLIIAATAIHHGLTLVTRDRSDYDKARVTVINPWDDV